MDLGDIKALVTSGKEIPRPTHMFSGGTNICDVGNGMLIKYGTAVRYEEAESTMFILEHTSVPVPKIFAVATEKLEHRDCTYIVMEKVPGVNLSEALPNLDAQARYNTARQISQYLEQLSSLDQKGPGLGVLGPVAGSFKNTGFFKQWRQYNEVLPTTTEEFIRYFAKKASPAVSPARREECNTSFDYQRPPFFSHGDLLPENIMVEDGRVTAIIDWEYAGWYPYF